MSSLLPPRQMVDGLAKVFAQVELIVRRYPRVEKIKTIGDAFMCSSGLLGPGVHEDITAVADLALELRDTKVCIVVLLFVSLFFRAFCSFCTFCTCVLSCSRFIVLCSRFVLLC